MRRFTFILGAGAVLVALSASVQAQQIHGDYVETRSADVYAGACIANGEVGLVGDQAILAWRVSEGSWNGVRLDGLAVAGVVKAGATLGDPFGDPYPARAVIIVDQKASDEQRSALISFAKEMAGELLGDVVRVDVAPIKLELSHAEGHPAGAMFRAGELAGIDARPIGAQDHLCGNEVTFYPPLTSTSHSMPAVAELDMYSGDGLGVSWTARGKRSAFVGTFAR